MKHMLCRKQDKCFQSNSLTQLTQWTNSINKHWTYTLELSKEHILNDITETLASNLLQKNNHNLFQFL